MEKRFSFDRIEGDYAVCYDGEGNKYDFKKALIPLEVGSLFTAKLDQDGNPFDVCYLKEETVRKKAELKSRLTALFNRSKKQ